MLKTIMHYRHFVINLIVTNMFHFYVKTTPYVMAWLMLIDWPETTFFA